MWQRVSYASLIRSALVPSPSCGDGSGEKTGTWYGLFNEWPEVTTELTKANCTTCEAEVLGALQKCWTGQDKSSRAPSLHDVKLNGEALEGMRFSVDQEVVSLAVNASQAEGQPLTALWVVTEEIVSDALGGAFEATNPLLADVFVDSVEKHQRPGSGGAAQRNWFDDGRQLPPLRFRERRS